MKTLRNICIAFALILGVGCTEPIELDLNDSEGQRLVVEGWITNQPGPKQIRLTLTSDYFANQPAPLATGANVTISDGESEVILEETEDGLYEISDYAGSPGKTYLLSIDYDGALYEASAYMHPITTIDSLSYDLDPYGESEDGDKYVTVLYCQEPEATLDHYIFRNYKNGILESDTLSEWEFTNDDGANGSYIDGVPIGYPIYEPGDTAGLEIISTSEEHYEFIIAMFLETEWRGSPFDTPPANIPSNVSNGALGFFSASAIERAEVVIE